MLQDSLHTINTQLQDATAHEAVAETSVAPVVAKSYKATVSKDTVEVAPLKSIPEILDAIFGRTAPEVADTTAIAESPVSYIDKNAVDSATHTNWFVLLADKFDFRNYDPLRDKDTHTAQSGFSGDPVPYKLSNDIFVTTTLLICFFIASFVVTRSMHALFVQVKNFFFNRDRNESLSLKSEGELKNHFFVVLLESFVLSLLFFSYTEYKISGQLVETSPYLLLFVDMGICILYFLVKYAMYNMFNWAFFKPEETELWSTSYNLVMLAKAVFLMPLVLIVLYFNLPPAVCIWAFVGLIGVFELLILFKTRQIFFNTLAGLFTTFLYFCTLELIPLVALVGVLIKTNEFLIM